MGSAKLNMGSAKLIIFKYRKYVVETQGDNQENPNLYIKPFCLVVNGQLSFPQKTHFVFKL